MRHTNQFGIVWRFLCFKGVGVGIGEPHIPHTHIIHVLGGIEKHRERKNSFKFFPMFAKLERIL